MIIINTIVNQNKNTQLVNFFHLPINIYLQRYKFKTKEVYNVELSAITVYKFL